MFIIIKIILIIIMSVRTLNIITGSSNSTYSHYLLKWWCSIKRCVKIWWDLRIETLFLDGWWYIECVKVINRWLDIVSWRLIILIPICNWLNSWLFIINTFLLNHQFIFILFIYFNLILYLINFMFIFMKMFNLVVILILKDI